MMQHKLKTKTTITGKGTTIVELGDDGKVKPDGKKSRIHNWWYKGNRW